MQLNIKLNLDVNQAQQLTKLIDSAVRAQGLQVAGAAAYFFQLLSEATAEAQRVWERSQQEDAGDTQTGDNNAATEVSQEHAQES